MRRLGDERVHGASNLPRTLEASGRRESAATVRIEPEVLRPTTWRADHGTIAAPFKKSREEVEAERQREWHHQAHEDKPEEPITRRVPGALMMCPPDGARAEAR